MIEKNSKSWQYSIKDLGKILFLVISFFGGFYLANTDLVNNLIGQYVSPEHVGIVTLFLAYAFKQLLKDNTEHKE